MHLLLCWQSWCESVDVPAVHWKSSQVRKANPSRRVLPIREMPDDSRDSCLAYVFRSTSLLDTKLLDTGSSLGCGRYFEDTGILENHDLPLAVFFLDDAAVDDSTRHPRKKANETRKPVRAPDSSTYGVTNLCPIAE